LTQSEIKFSSRSSVLSHKRTCTVESRYHNNTH